MSTQSRHSRRAVPTNLSAYALALGERTGVLMTRLPSEANTSSKEVTNLESRSRIRNLKRRPLSSRVTASRHLGPAEQTQRQVLTILRTAAAKGSVDIDHSKVSWNAVGQCPVAGEKLSVRAIIVRPPGLRSLLGLPTSTDA